MVLSTGALWMLLIGNNWQWLFGRRLFVHRRSVRVSSCCLDASINNKAALLLMVERWRCSCWFLYLSCFVQLPHVGVNKVGSWSESECLYVWLRVSVQGRTFSSWSWFIVFFFFLRFSSCYWSFGTYYFSFTDKYVFFSSAHYRSHLRAASQRHCWRIRPVPLSSPRYWKSQQGLLAGGWTTFLSVGQMGK